MQTVVLDTNALLMPFEIGINLDAEVRNVLGDVRFVVPGPLIGELKHLDNRYARAALALARSREIVQSPEHGDNSVLDVARRENAYILTNDKELRRRARAQRIPLIYLRSGTHLVVETYRWKRRTASSGQPRSWRPSPPRWLFCTGTGCSSSRTRSSCCSRTSAGIPSPFRRSSGGCRSPGPPPSS